MSSKAFLFLVPALTVPALAQSPIPQVAPRAHWVLTPGVTTPFTQRRESPGAASIDKMYVFGGSDGNANTTVHNALYEFDGTAWTLKTADYAVGSPTPRTQAAVAWNFTTNKLVVFGGGTGTGPVGGPIVASTKLADTWEWDPGTNLWTDVTPVGASPSARNFSSMAWEPVTGGMLLFGGLATAHEGDTWLFVGGAWVQVGSAGVGTPPPRRQHHLMTRTNLEFNDIIMVGGQDAGLPNTATTPHFLDVWTWDAATSTWNQIIPTSAAIPPCVVANQGVYDSLRKRVVLTQGNGVPTAEVPGYNAQPSGWSGEFDCVTNEWLLYGGATPGTGDPVIGKCSRYFAAFVPALGKVYKVSGQATTTAQANATYEYQATPVASTVPSVPLCTGSGGLMTLAADNRPWLGTTFSMSATGMAALSYNLGFVGFATTSVPVNSVLPQGIPGCLVLQTLDLEFFVGIGSSATWTIGVPSTVTLAGLVGHAQYASAEFDLSLNITAIGTSNLVSFVLGQN